MSGLHETKAIADAIRSLQELAVYAPFMAGGKRGRKALDALDRKDAAIGGLVLLAGLENVGEVMREATKDRG